MATFLFRTLSAKIVGILVVFFLAAVTVIGLTLMLSWRFEGGAAAINDAGSERMHSYRLAYLLSQSIQDGPQNPALSQAITREIGDFEQTLRRLERGDPSRPLSLPKEAAVQTLVRELQHRWQHRVKPLVLQIMKARDVARKKALMAEYQPVLVEFVSNINRLVMMVERNNTHYTALLRSFQVGLVILALFGTAFLIYWFFPQVVRPVNKLQHGIRSMAAGDFGVRLPVESRDEFGVLAAGFNRMADHLENLYGTLEQRVEEKTRSLEDKNRDLQMLYEVAAFLNEPATLEEICQGVLTKMVQLLGAQGGVVRLVNHESRLLPVFAHQGVSAQFLARETELSLGQCLCGRAARDGTPVNWDLSQSSPQPMLHSCRKEGFEGVAVMPIRAKKQVLGAFDLFFTRYRELAETEIRLLETVARHLGVAVENLRLVSREKEMAVSEERNLLAQELHDSIAQSLAFLNIQVQLLQESLGRDDTGEALEVLGQIREGVQESYDDVRELLVHFRTRVDHADLESAIRSALEKFEGQTGIKTAYDAGAVVPLAPEYVIQVLHIIQEALSNVRKHAAASRVEVLTRYNGQYRITVQDDGKGFDPGNVGGETHVGIKIMRERAHRIGAELKIAAAPEKGTRVTLVLPGPKDRA
jgi:two-component system nitrate/nitrite sensor histidine kinase NarX